MQVYRKQESLLCLERLEKGGSYFMFLLSLKLLILTVNNSYLGEERVFELSLSTMLGA